MALHDFICHSCGQPVSDFNVPISVGAARGAPPCPQGCGKTSWIPKISRMDAYEPFQEYEVYDGRGRPVVVESMRQMRQIEHDSEQQARNGEGQQMVWRPYSNDVSNTHEHIFTKDTSRAMDHDLAAESDAEVSFGGGVVRQAAGEKIPFRTDMKTQRGVPIAKEVGRTVTEKHGTVD